MTWALEQRTGSMTTKTVLFILANCHNNHTGKCCPSVRLLAREAETTERTVRRALSELEAKGFLQRIEIRRENGSQAPSQYALNLTSQTDTVSPPPDTVSPLEPEVNLTTNGSKNEPLVQARILRKREIEELWGACEAYVQTPPTAKSPRAAYAKLVRELHDAGWTPQDVEVRAEAYRKHPTFSKCELTLAALAKWGETFQTETQTREARMQAVYRKAGMV